MTEPVNDIWKDPNVKAALKQGRPADDIAVLARPKCGRWGYYNQGSHFWCRFCKQGRYCCSEGEEFTCFCCSNIGVSGTTPVHVKAHDDGTFEARMGGSMLGQTNMSDEEMAACRHNPFHEDWHDNYFCGKGKTREEAIEAVKKDMASLADLLWAE